MDAQRMAMLVDRAFRLLNKVDENDTEATIRLVDMAISDLSEVRAHLPPVTHQQDRQAARADKHD